MLEKRYQYWASENGKPIIKWSEWFRVPDNITQEKWQVKNKLKNEYKSE